MSKSTFKTSSALSYFGSDAEVARDLAAMLDHCQHVVIPFVGGGSIIPHLKARAIVANDLNDGAINFYKVLSDRCGVGCKEDLIKRCEHTLSHPSEIEHAIALLMNPMLGASFVEKAWAYWALCWIGRKGKGGTSSMGGAPSVRWAPDGGTNATRIQSAASDLEAWAKTFERCEWTCLDFNEVISKVKDDPRCGIYCDPPWVDAGDVYGHKFHVEDHIRMSIALSRFREATVVIRYGDHEGIRNTYDGWTIIEATARTQTNKQLGEIWITNRRSP
jgi:site-specific DNA-adenine methylase